MNTCSFSTSKQLNNPALSSPSLMFTEAHTKSEGNNPNFNDYPPKTERWNETNKDSFSNTPSGDFFHRPVVFPPTCLFVDPTTVLIQSKIDVHKRNSLPKIYSVDSFDENYKKESAVGKSYICQKNNNNEFNNKIYYTNKVEKVEEIPTAKNMEEEDLFSENKNKSENQTDSYSICLQEKISSLFDMLRSSETNQEEQDIDIFKETPLKIERSDFSYSETIKNYNNLKFNSNKENVAGSIFSSGKSDYIFKNQLDSNNFKDKKPSGGKNFENICTAKSKVNYEIPFYFGQSKKDFNNHRSLRQTEEVIYDKRSLIELYHTKEAHQGLNTGSTPGELSTFSLWPVTAEYIQVSKSKRPQKCESVSSDHSIPLSKSFGKSFYSLHLNKKYEQKQLYDGDLLVLENPERSVQPESSSCSLRNQSYSIFDQEKNYKSYEKIHKTQNVLSGKFNNQMQLLQQENISNLEKGRDLNGKRKNLKDVKKTLAVHYKDCGDSFKTTGKNFNRENFDFLKVNGFDDNNNWNSFISIFTSKVGPTSQINHHRMFRKVINTFTSDSLTCNNVFGNVHTLTSNGGPFRLFDINGYPLTDSAGNVLKDPYSKSVVTLDSTGFPKDDIKVFDAAGNSPNDINFDPTQKPKTNSIIIKLTDNFKRPLHLFDKYGRPLTDSCGKLQVNIHGRPLLRFDNFGRPNTDYRGGPLYTDNGYRWSYRTGDSLSSNQLSNESLMPKKLCGFLETESRQNSYDNFSLQDSGDKNRVKTENLDSKTVDNRAVPTIYNSESDIWTKVENLLQKFPKNKKVEPKVSQTSVIINNVTITQNPIEKEFLKSIIYHNNIVQKDVNHFNRIHSQPFTNHKSYLDFQNINSSCFVDKRVEPNRTYCVGKVLDTDGYKPYCTTPFPFRKNIVVKGACSKCLNFDHPKHISSNKVSNEQIFNVGKAFTCEAGDMLRSPIAATIHSYPKNGTNKSCLRLKNHDYLNNLCNKILKHEIDYSNKTKYPMNHEVYKKNTDWTDTSITEFPSSIGSKYTTGFTTQTDSPVYFSDTSKNHSQDRNIQNRYCKSYLKQRKPLDYYEREIDVLHKDKYCSEYYQNKSKKDTECERQKIRYSSNEQMKDPFQNKSGPLSPKPNEDKMSIKILNKGNKHYEIKVTEMLSKIMNPKLNFNLFSTGKNNIEKSNSLHTCPKIEIETSLKSKYSTENSTNKLREKNDTITENYKEKINNSLFRFSSDEIIESTPRSERNIKTSYSQKSIYPSDSNVCKNVASFKVHHDKSKHLTDQKNNTFTHDKAYENKENHEDYSIKPLTQSEQSKELPSYKKDRLHKNTNINRKNTFPVKKPVSSNKECNLASFFGSPMKYVLNKLDGKRSLKPNKTDATVKKKTLSNSKEKVKRLNGTTYPKDKVKPINDIKTLYDITKSSKKNMNSSSEKAEIKNHKDKLFVNEQDTLLAFRSKSCTGLVCQDKDVLMCYSGDSQRAKCKNLSQDFPLSNNKVQKSMSATSYITVERSGNKHYVRRSIKYEKGKETPKNGQHSLKPNMVRRKKYNKLDYCTQKCSKSRKGSSGRNSKSPLFSSRTKAKEISLFKKVEPEGKYMLKIKR